MRLDDIDLSDIEGFWTLPMTDREAAFATLRREDPIRFFAEIDFGEFLPAGPGYWAVTRHADVVEASATPSGSVRVRAPTSPTCRPSSGSSSGP